MGYHTQRILHKVSKLFSRQRKTTWYRKLFSSRTIPLEFLHASTSPNFFDWSIYMYTLNNLNTLLTGICLLDWTAWGNLFCSHLLNNFSFFKCIHLLNNKLHIFGQFSLKNECIFQNSKIQNSMLFLIKLHQAKSTYTMTMTENTVTVLMVIYRQQMTKTKEIWRIGYTHHEIFTHAIWWDLMKV